MNGVNKKINPHRKFFRQLDGDHIFALIEEKMERERCFLDPYLTMERLADEMNVHRNALSAAVNQCSGMNFPRWLASYRVRELERLSALPENIGVTLERLAVRSGFSNRNSFYRSFKDIRGTTPGEWRSSVKNKQIKQ